MTETRTPADLDRAIRFAVRMTTAALAIAFSTGIGVIWLIVQQGDDISSIDDELSDVVAAVVEPELVETWTLEPLFDQARVDGERMEFVTKIECTDAVIKSGRPVRFLPRLVVVDTAPEIAFAVEAITLRSTVVCGSGEIDLPVEWEDLIGQEQITAPAVYALQIEATSPGFQPGFVQSAPFTIVPAN